MITVSYVYNPRVLLSTRHTSTDPLLSIIVPPFNLDDDGMCSLLIITNLNYTNHSSIIIDEPFDMGTPTRKSGQYVLWYFRHWYMSSWPALQVRAVQVAPIVPGSLLPLMVGHIDHICVHPTHSIIDCTVMLTDPAKHTPADDGKCESSITQCFISCTLHIISTNLTVEMENPQDIAGPDDG